MIIKVGELEPLGPIGVYAYGCVHKRIETAVPIIETRCLCALL